ncbi:MAG: FAD-dependent oxidoreductase [Balneolaceae bacterium]|nr:FAD-dependent oxidoreductase [Balneolaceae bacterium]
MTHKHLKGLFVFFFLLTVSPITMAQDRVDRQQEGTHYQADVIVYGGTSAAVTAAVEASRMNKSVIVVSPDKHLGGLSSGGLGFTDTGNKEVIGGLSREFYQRVFDYYQKQETWRWQDPSEFGNRGQGTTAMDEEHGTMWIFEPEYSRTGV